MPLNKKGDRTAPLCYCDGVKTLATLRFWIWAALLWWFLPSVLFILCGDCAG